jgi:Xaa-Pro aminopeptidase
MSRHQQRRDRLRREIRKAGADALLVTNFINVTYLTGFTGDDSFLLVRKDGDLLLSDRRYTIQLTEECPELEFVARAPGQTMLDWIGKSVRSAGIAKLAIEADSITVGLRDRVAEKLSKVELVAVAGLVETLREIKDAEEVSQLRQAARIAEKAFADLRAKLRPDTTEKEIADDLDYQMRKLGAKRSAFPAIVGVGPRAALPHAVPTDRPVSASPLLLIDWGANGGLYNSDLTRVLVTGKISPKLQRIYEVVYRAQTEAIAAIRPGVTGHEIDSIARGIIADAGHGKHFGHGLGHGLGLEVHEAPRLATKSETVLKPGMVVTVEPGIYLTGWGGIRIEDDVLVTRNGHEVLTEAPKRFEEMVV